MTKFLYFNHKCRECQLLKILRMVNESKNAKGSFPIPHMEWNINHSMRALVRSEKGSRSPLLAKQTKFIWPREIQQNALYSTFSRTFHFSTCYGESRKKKWPMWSRAIYGDLISESRGGGSLSP